MAQLWLRGAAFKQYGRTEEEHGVAVYASEYMCRQFEEQPMFIIPLDCKEDADIIFSGSWEVIRLGVVPVPLTAERHPLDKE